MNTKLTLTIEPSVIQRAKLYAKQTNRSLSGIIENYLRVITGAEIKSETEITPLVRALRGSFKAPSDFDYIQELSKSLSEKYL